MFNLIELTELTTWVEGNIATFPVIGTVFVSPLHIHSLRPHQCGTSLQLSDKIVILVKQTPEEIKDLLRDALIVAPVSTGY